MELEFSQRIFEKSLNIKLHEILSCGGRVVPRGLTDRRTEMTKLNNRLPAAILRTSLETLLFLLKSKDIYSKLTKYIRFRVSNKYF